VRSILNFVFGVAGAAVGIFRTIVLSLALFVVTMGTTLAQAAPVVTSVTADDGHYDVGTDLRFIVTFDGNVAVAGVPKLAITLGGTAKVAIFTLGSGSTTLAFDYFVQAGDHGPLAITALSLNGGKIADSTNSSNDADLTLNNVKSMGGITIGTVSTPVVTSVDVPIDGYYRAGSLLDFRVHFSEDVIATAPKLQLDIGGHAVTADYTGGSSTTLNFEYTVQDGDIDMNGITLTTLLPSGSIVSAVDNSTIANLMLNGVAPTTQVLVNTIRPTVALSTTAPHDVRNGDPITITSVFSEPVSGLAFTDFSATNANISNLTTTDNITYNMTVSFFGSGTTDLGLPADSALNIGGNGNQASSTLSFNHGDPPVASATSASTAFRTPVNIPAVFSGSVTSVSAATTSTGGTVTVNGQDLVYTPHPDFYGPDSFTYTVSNPFGTSAPATVTIDVAPPTLSLDTVSLPAPTRGVAYSQTLVASGGAPTYTFAIVAGSLPNGLTLSQSTGVISGVTTVTGSYSFAVQVTDQTTATATQPYSFTVISPTFTFTPATLPDGQVAVSYPTTSLDAAGGIRPYTYTITAGALPPGLTLSQAGVIGGTPTVAGSFNLTVTASDDFAVTGSQAYTIDIDSAVPIVTSASVSAAANTTTAIDLSSSFVGGPVTGVAITSAPAHGTASISTFTVTYEPIQGYSGTDSFTYTATGPGGTSAPATVTIAVTPPTLALTPAGALTAGQVGAAWRPVTLTATNGTAPYSFALASGALPPGLTLASTGTLSGTPTAAGDFTFSIRATDTYGATGSATYTLAVAEKLGSVVIRQRTDGDDAVFGFTSPEPALNLSISTADGAGQSAAISLPAGTYTVTADDMSGAGYGLTSLTCADADSTGDIAHRTATIALAPGETVTCTFTSVNSAKRTGELIEQFMSDRADLILANQPDADRRLDRLNGVMSGGDNPGSALLGYISRLADSGSLTVNTSLAAIDAMTGTQKQSRFDAWFAGTFARLDGANGDGEFATAAIGADYLLTPDLLVGAFAQFDRMSEDLDGNADASGTGWLAGPYVTARLADHLYLDLLAAAGRSSNSISPFGTYTDDFDATRYLLSATLEGQWQWDAWTFSPRARVSYFEETSDGYTDSLGVAIAPVTTGKGQVSVGPGLLYRFVTDGEITVDTGLRLDGIADIDNDGDWSLDDLHGRIEGSLSISFPEGARLGLSTAYDGLGGDIHAISGRLSVSLPMR
jgi:hypothetical protein